MSYQSCGFAVSTLGFVHFGLTKSLMLRFIAECKFKAWFDGSMAASEYTLSIV